MSQYEREWAAWPLQRSHRIAMDDDLPVPREVEHFVFFSRRRKARSAAVELDAAGFDVTLRRIRLETMLVARRDEPLDDESVARFLREVIEIVGRHDGEYDGWGATVEVKNPA